MNRQLNYTETTRRRALIVEDEVINRMILGNMLQDQYEVLYAGNGLEAMELLHQPGHRISVVLLDLNMPVMSGDEVLEQMHEDEQLRRIPIIVLTSDKGAEVRALKKGASDFIAKPYDMPDVIKARIERIIELAEDRTIIREAEHDKLTGLYNRSFFLEYSRQMDHFHPDRRMDVIALNIDHFHLVNEILGKEFGDRILEQIGLQIRRFLSTGEGLATRAEADRFFLYCTHQDDCSAFIEQVANAVRQMGQENTRIRIRAGIYPDADKKIELERRMDRAKNACDAIRNNYTRDISYYDAGLHERELFEQRLAGDFQRALEEKQFKVVYQPKYAIQSEKPVLHSAEALVRWDHPQLGRVNPGVFVPVFEKNGLIRQIDNYVWQEVARQVRDWKNRFQHTVSVSVNVSRMDMYDPQLQDKFQSLLARNGLTTKDLHLEITESAYADDADRMIRMVSDLRKEGFLIEMDDFGTGYSTLSMLQTLPIDALKLDMNFIRSAATGRRSYRIIELMMDVAKYLNVPVIAEGVETEEQYQTLKEVGCDIIQGYYFSKPVSAQVFETFLMKQEGVTS